jgi:dihydrodipicolinate synthase/N-acetylneuraminate lyase
MKTSAVLPADLARSVVAVPPLARNADLGFNEVANRRLADHLIAGGVSTILYGGNANMANVSTGEFRPLLEMLTRLGRGEAWIIPSVGPDYGKLRDQAVILRDFEFPTAMVLPMAAMATAEGTARAVRDFVQSWGKPVTLYVKSEAQITPNQVAALVDAGEVVAVKYAIPRKDIADDAYLDALVRLIGRGRIVSGMGERPALDHMRLYGLASFTSGCVSIAPRASMAMLRAARDGRSRICARRSSWSPCCTTRSRSPASPTWGRSCRACRTRGRPIIPRSAPRPRRCSTMTVDCQRSRSV